MYTFRSGRRPTSSIFVTIVFHTRHTFPASVVYVANKATTPWGLATTIDEAKVSPRAGEKRFGSVVQLLEDESGGVLVRFAYTTGGAARRGPVTLRQRDLERLREVVAGSHPALAEALGWKE